MLRTGLEMTTAREWAERSLGAVIDVAQNYSPLREPEIEQMTEDLKKIFEQHVAEVRAATNGPTIMPGDLIADCADFIDHNSTTETRDCAKDLLNRMNSALTAKPEDVVREECAVLCDTYEDWCPSWGQTSHARAACAAAKDIAIAIRKGSDG